MKHLLLALPFVLVSCASNPPLPMPTGDIVPVNSLATAELLAHDAGLVIVGDDRAEPEVRKRLLHRAKPTDNYTTVADGELVERIVTVPFDYASAEFSPDPAQAYRILQLIAIADRVEVRGRTDARQSTPKNEKWAKRRAMAARNYLIDRGMPSELIAVNYMASGNPVASPDNRRGRAMNRRAELEFYIDNFATADSL